MRKPDDPTGSAPQPAAAAGADTRLSRPLAALDRVTFTAERPVRRLVGSNRLNPLPHAGTISVFLLGVVVLTGIYITLFFQYGSEASYRAVSAMEGNAIQRVVRAVHRYSSAALVLTTVVHAWRIFVGARFTGRPRRWRWATGVAALLVIWLAGVTGYWLVQDVRAQALSDAASALLAPSAQGAAWATRHLSGAGTGSGSWLLVVVWFVHLFLTGVVGWFLFRHLRRSRLPWLPPRHWMILMGGALVLVGLAFPVGMLPAASASRLPGHMPLDPFVLFLLPPLLSGWRWAAVAAGGVATALVLWLPRLLRAADPAPVVIDADACTGCELCVVDCPYRALTMVGGGAGPTGDGTGPTGDGPGAGNGPTGAGHRAIAQVDPAACVACGICVGSCAFDAITLPGRLGDLMPGGVTGDGTGHEKLAVAGRPVVVACDRHLELSADALRAAGAPDVDAGTEPVVLRVRCAGMFAPAAIGHLMNDGATGVHVVGCPPHDCRYGVGNRLAAERLSGERAPHPPRRWQGVVVEDWVAPTELAGALNHPGAHPSVDDSRLPGRRDVLAGAAVLVALSLVAVVFATRAPFTGSDRSGVRVVVDHEAGNELLAVPEGGLVDGGGPTAAGAVTEADDNGPVGAVTAVEVRLDGQAVARRSVPRSGPVAVGLIDVGVDPGPATVSVVAETDGGPVTVYEGAADLVAGRRLVIPIRDVPPPPGVAEGRDVFNSRAAGCPTCHSVDEGDDGIGPSLYGVATRAGTRVEGLTPELYLRNSILLPDQFVVPGFPAGQMLPIYRERFSEEQLDALVAYLMTLTDEPAGATQTTEGG
ncbi:MAG: hydrogenase iron-sulfur subunit [Acidimicrobiales bacterium]